MTTPSAIRPSFEAGHTTDESLFISEVHTAHSGKLDVLEHTKPLGRPCSDHNINKILPSSDKEQVEIMDETLANLKSYVPVERPSEDHPELNYRPIILWRTTTIILGILYLLIGIGTGTLLYKAGSDGEFRFTDEYVYFTARYIPSIIGTITVIFFRTIVNGFLRITPYIAMSDYGHLVYDGASVEQSIAFRYFPQQRFFFQRGINMTLFADISLMIASILIVPAKTALFATKKLDDRWVLTVRSIPAYCLIGSYALMAIFTFTVTVWLWSRQTGLKWDPISIADQLALFRNPNTLSYFGGLEREVRATEVNVLKDARFRLGYWQTGLKNIWYGVGVVNTKNLPPPEKSEGLATKILESTGDSAPSTHSQEGQSIPSSTTHQRRNTGSRFGRTTQATQADTAERMGTPDQGFCMCDNRNEKCEHYPYHHTPLINPMAIKIWMILVGIGICLCLYTLFAGQIINGFSLANTWYDYFPPYFDKSANGEFFGHTNTNQTLLPYDNVIEFRGNLLLYAIVFRALPVGVAGMLVGFMSIVDINFGFIQSFVGMHKTAGSAPETILLEYFAASPLQVPLDAWKNEHWKVAWFSTLSTMSPLFPIFVGGMLTITNTGERVYFDYSIPAFSAVFIFLIVYFVSLCFAHPTENRLLPRRVSTLSDLLVMCYRSQFLRRSPDFDISDAKASKKLMAARIFVRQDKYLFGVYNGTDGEKHLGFDIAEDVDGEKDIVEWVPPISQGWTDRLRRRRASRRQQQQDLEKVGTD